MRANLLKQTQEVLSLRYIKILRMFLLTVGGWPEVQFGEKPLLIGKIQRKSFSVQTFIIMIGSGYYLVSNFSKIDFLVTGHIFITVSLSILMTVRSLLTNFKEYKLTIETFVHFHLKNEKHKGGHYKKTCELIDKISLYFTLFQMITMVGAAALFNLTPLYEDYKMGAFSNPRPGNLSLDYSIFFAYPGFRQDDFFYLAATINAYFSYNCGVLVCAIDLLLSLMVFQIIGHIYILMFNLESMTRPKSKSLRVFGVKVKMANFNAVENELVKLKLKDIIDHHRSIVSFANRISNIFGPMLAFNYLYHLVSGCVLLLECSNSDPKALARFGPLTIIIFGQLIELSVIFEIVGYMSERLIDSVYYSPWECMDVPNQRTVRFLLSRVQTPIEVTAIGIVSVGVKTMQGIIKTTLSYYAILRTLSE